MVSVLSFSLCLSLRQQHRWAVLRCVALNHLKGIQLVESGFKVCESIPRHAHRKLPKKHGTRPKCCFPFPGAAVSKQALSLEFTAITSELLNHTFEIHSFRRWRGSHLLNSTTTKFLMHSCAFLFLIAGEQDSGQSLVLPNFRLHYFGDLGRAGRVTEGCELIR